MKLFNAIAAATVIGASSFAITTPAQASDEWIYVGSDYQNVRYYIKPQGCKGNFCYALSKSSEHAIPYSAQYECSSWRFRMMTTAGVNKNTKWLPIKPGKVSEAYAKIAGC